MTNKTTINIPKEVRDALKGEKEYARETYAEIIKKLIKKVNEKNG